MPAWKMKLGPDRLVAAASIGTAIALVLFGLAREPVTALLASLIAGVSWIAAMATITVSAQVSLPDWVRGRGLAIYMTVLFGSMTAGSAIWGKVAGLTGLSATLFVAAAGALLAIPLTWHWKLQTAGQLYLATSKTITDRFSLRLNIESRTATIAPHFSRPWIGCGANGCAMGPMLGAYSKIPPNGGDSWKTFFVESWLEHLRQHERVTNTDSLLQQTINGSPPLSGDYAVTSRRGAATRESAAFEKFTYMWHFCFAARIYRYVILVRHVRNRPRRAEPETIAAREPVAKGRLGRSPIGTAPLVCRPERNDASNGRKAR